MDTEVLIAHAAGEDALAEKLAVPIREAGYQVSHQGARTGPLFESLRDANQWPSWQQSVLLSKTRFTNALIFSALQASKMLAHPYAGKRE